MIGEIEIVDRLEKGKVGAPREARQTGLLAVRDLFRRQECEEIAVRPRFALGAVDELPPDAARIREMQAFEERVEIRVRSGGPGRG